ncbi:hypothetical protein [Pseudomonas oryzihabitans]|uniref:hypothetical protein n=1 Tax=Pseudomonas oryzihabitans TaxID=47885 RepID=UPI0012DED5BB|nr:MULTISPECIES: hypothetical protein [Pseudomonas]NMZ44165.1 hypothetical protein [Pseudomonas oryzihabitans]
MADSKQNDDERGNDKDEVDKPLPIKPENYEEKGRKIGASAEEVREAAEQSGSSVTDEVLGKQVAENRQNRNRLKP